MTKKPDKYDEKLKADLAKFKAESKARMKAQIKASKAEIRNINQLFSKDKITYKQYIAALKQFNKK
jgi:DNA-binding protein H-NS